MDSRKKISIIIATYNAAAVLADCLQSIEQARPDNFEIVLADGGSTDQTRLVADRFSHLPISWKSEPDRGIYNALNKGIERANGDWLYFLGADDRLLPGFAEIVRQLSDPQSVYYGISQEYHTGPKPGFELITGRFSNYKLAKYCLNHQSILYPRSVFDKYRYDEQYKVLADYALNIKVWGDQQFSKIFVPIPIVQYHMTGFSAHHTDELFRRNKSSLIKQSMGTLVYLRYLLKKYRKIAGGEKNWH